MTAAVIELEPYRAAKPRVSVASFALPRTWGELWAAVWRVK